MQNELKELCASPDLNWYNFDGIDFFQMVVGEEFPPEERTGVVFYGRATNVWDLDCNEGINAIATYKSGQFFPMVRKIATNLYGEEYPKKVGWSNIRKAIPRGIKDISKDSDFCYYTDPYNKRILRREIEISSPKVLVCITGTQPHLRHDSILFEEFPNLQLVRKEENGIELYKENELYVIITERPEQRPSEIVNQTIERVSSIIKELI